MDEKIRKITNFLFEPMYKLRNWEFNEEQARLLCERLTTLNDDVLTKTAKELAATAKFKPTLMEIINLYQHYNPVSIPSNKLMPWVDKEKKMSSMIQTYIESLLSHPEYIEAVSEGWGSQLINFARHTANTQAQKIFGYQLWGWSGDAVPNAYWNEYKSRLSDWNDSRINIWAVIPYGLKEKWRG